MRKGDYLSTLLRVKQTVFTVREVMLLWGDINLNAVKVRLNYFAREGDLYRVRRGIYAKDKDYDRWELATKIFTPAYISFETVLTRAGMVFQYYGQIFVASYLTRELSIEGQTYSYRRMKETVLTNATGIEQGETYAVASTERAFLDVLYQVDNYYFDNLGGIDWEKLRQIVPIYENKRMEKRIEEYEADYKEDHGA